MDALKAQLVHLCKFRNVFQYNSREVGERAVEKQHSSFKFVPDCFKTQDMCNKAVRKDIPLLKFVSDRFKIQEIHHKAVCEDL